MSRSGVILITLSLALIAVASGNPMDITRELPQQGTYPDLSINCPPVNCYLEVDSVPAPYANLNEFINAEAL